jgi:transposase
VISLAVAAAGWVRVSSPGDYAAFKSPPTPGHDLANGFEVLPRRWVVERTLASLGRCRRLSKDWEKQIASAEAWVLIAHIRRVTRYLARICKR